MGLFSNAKKQGIPGRDSVGGMGSAMARPAPPRPTLVQGGPAYFTPEGYRPPMQPQQAFMPTDTMGDPIGDMFRRQLPPVRIPLPRVPPQKDPRDDFISIGGIGGDDGIGDPRMEPMPMPDPSITGGGAPNPPGVGGGTADMMVIVYGPDGKMYSSPGAARDAGVTDFSMTNPNSKPFPPDAGFPDGGFPDGGFPDGGFPDVGIDDGRGLTRYTGVGGRPYVDELPPMPIDMPQPPSRPQLPADFNPAAGIPGSGVPPLGNPGDFRDGLPSVTDFDNRFSPSQLDDMRDKYRPEQEPVVPPVQSVTTPQPFLQQPQAPRTEGIPAIGGGTLDNPIDTKLPEPPMAPPRDIAPPREIPREIAPPMAPPKRIAPPSFEREPREMPREEPIQAPTPPAQIEQIKQVLPQLPPEQLMDILPQLPPEVIQELPEELIRQIMPMMPEPMMPEPMQPRMQMPGPIATPTPRLQRPSLPMMPMMGGRGRR